MSSRPWLRAGVLLIRSQRRTTLVNPITPCISLLMGYIASDGEVWGQRGQHSPRDLQVRRAPQLRLGLGYSGVFPRCEPHAFFSSHRYCQHRDYPFLQLRRTPTFEQPNSICSSFQVSELSVLNSSRICRFLSSPDLAHFFRACLLPRKTSTTGSDFL